MDHRLSIKIVFLMVFVLPVAHLSFGMDQQRIFFKPSSEQKQCIQLVESCIRNQEQKNRKLLEHSCFKGESLNFQNEFFTADYTQLPPQQEFINRIVLKNENDMRSIFGYHQHYRKICYAALGQVEEYVSLVSPDKKTFIKLSGSTFNILISSRHGFLLENMRQAWSSYDYPQMLLILEEIASSKYL